MDDMYNYCIGYVNFLFLFWLFFLNCRVFVVVVIVNLNEDFYFYFLKYLIKYFEKKFIVL